MNKLIAYIHFIGFFPAYGVTIRANPDGGFTNLAVSILFSWSVIFWEAIKAWLF